MIDERDRDILKYEFINNCATTVDSIEQRGRRLIDTRRAKVWLKARAKAVVKPVFNGEAGRYVNHFTLGADPEFIFVTSTGRTCNAADSGLGMGTFVGCDANNRLAEIRPAPNRSSLAVTASILTELRAFGAMSNKWPIWKAQWLAFPYVNEGIGGHIQFGRLQKTARGKIDTPALDSLTKWLEQHGIFNAAATDWRKNDRNRGTYGQYGDLRLQSFGYEYRTMPSWLESPWLTFFVLTLAKLLVHDGKAKLQYLDSAKHLLSYYAPLDDDAALALYVLQRRGLPTQSMIDLRYGWGLFNEASANLGTVGTNQIVIPASIAPTVEEQEELFSHFLTNTPLHTRPSGMLLHNTNMQVKPGMLSYSAYAAKHHHPGIVDELGVECVMLENLPVCLEFAGTDTEAPSLQISCPFYMKSRIENFRAAFYHVCVNGHFSVNYNPPTNRTNTIYIMVTRSAVSQRFKSQIKALLLSGFIPFWHYQNVDAKAVKEWQVLSTITKPLSKGATYFDVYTKKWEKNQCVA